MSKVSALTARCVFWLEHLRVCARRGRSRSSYAAEQGLSISAFQQAKSRLQQRGLWLAAGPGFVCVQAAPSLPVASVYRVLLPNGVVVESAGDELSAVLAAAARVS